MEKASFDISKPLALYARMGEAGVAIVFTFLNSNGTDHAITAYNFELPVRRTPASTTDLFKLIIGTGLTVFGAGSNKLRVELTAAQATQLKETNFWLLRSIANDNTWLNGPFTFHNGVFEGVEDAADIIVGAYSVNVIVNTQALPAGTWITVDDDFDASAGVFPSAVGTGASGAIQKFNNVMVGAGKAGFLGSEPCGDGDILIALQDDPTDDFTITGWKKI